jgi:hypothetical protein
MEYVKFNWNYFLGLEFHRVPEIPGYMFLLVKYQYEPQLIFHEESQNFTNYFWTSQLLNKYFSKELELIYESRYLHV